jgi:hypothetical protein
MTRVPLTRPTLILRELGIVAAIVVVAAIVGYGLGIVLNDQFGVKKGPATPRRAPAAQAGSSTTAKVPGATTSSTAASTATTPAASSSTTPGASVGDPARTTLDLGQKETLSVTGASLLAATKPAGTAVNAARVTVQATVRNAGTATVTPPVDRLFIRYGGTTVRPDPNAASAAGDLLKPLAPGKTASGELHFETRGAMTKAMAGLKRVAIRFGPQALIVDVG